MVSYVMLQLSNLVMWFRFYPDIYDIYLHVYSYNIVYETQCSVVELNFCLFTYCICPFEIELFEVAKFEMTDSSALADMNENCAMFILVGMV